MSNNAPTILNPTVDDIPHEMGMVALAVVGSVLSIAPLILVAFFVAWVAGLAIPSRSMNNRFRIPDIDVVLPISISLTALHFLLVGIGLERKEELEATIPFYSILLHSLRIVTALALGFTLAVVIVYRVWIGFAAVLRATGSQGNQRLHRATRHYQYVTKLDESLHKGTQHSGIATRATEIGLPNELSLTVGFTCCLNWTHPSRRLAYAVLSAI